MNTGQTFRGSISFALAATWLWVRQHICYPHVDRLHWQDHRLWRVCIYCERRLPFDDRYGHIKGRHERTRPAPPYRYY